MLGEDALILLLFVFLVTRILCSIDLYDTTSCVVKKSKSDLRLILVKLIRVTFHSVCNVRGDLLAYIALVSVGLFCHFFIYLFRQYHVIGMSLIHLPNLIAALNHRYVNSSIICHTVLSIFLCLCGCVITACA